MANVLPNLELLEYQAKVFLAGNDEVLNKIYEHYKNYTGMLQNIPMEIDVQMFSQTWPTTAMAFDLYETDLAQDIETEAYTVVCREPISETYVVFVNNTPCYVVTDPTPEFYEDLNNKKLCTIVGADKRY